MSPQSDPKRKASGDFGRKLNERIDDAATRLEQESDRVITYLNDEVVPAIRQGSSKALRVAADRLQRLAEYMDQNRSR
jgi:F0F1-type ATP synthase membrane subunit b/b'